MEREKSDKKEKREGIFQGCCRYSRVHYSEIVRMELLSYIIVGWKSERRISDHKTQRLSFTLCMRVVCVIIKESRYFGEIDW